MSCYYLPKIAQKLLIALQNTVRRPWVAFRVRLESIASSTAAENWAMMSGGARYVSSSVTVLPKTMRPVKVAMKVD